MKVKDLKAIKNILKNKKNCNKLNINIFNYLLQ